MSLPLRTVLVVVAAALAACDQAPGPASSSGEPPALSAFSFSPHTYPVPDGLDTDNLEIPLEMSVTVADVDDDVDRVSYIVQSPYSDVDPLAVGTLARGTGSLYEAEADLSVPIGEIGVYTVLVYAVDRSGLLSNEVRGMLRIQGTGEPPVIVSVDVPETITRPAIGEEPRRIPFVVEVSDPDGLANVNAVQFWNAASPDIRIDMFDDGDDGDDVAGDGRYTRVVEIAAGNQPGTNVFNFQAADRAGLVSEVVAKTVVVE